MMVMVQSEVMVLRVWGNCGESNDFVGSNG